MTDALFRINADSSDQGFDGTNSQSLTFTLKTLPLSGVRTWELQVFDADLFAADASPSLNPPRSSAGAPELTLVGSTSGQRVAPSTGPAGSITTALPASGFHSWIVRSIVNGGKRLTPGGATVDDPSLIHERMVVIRDVSTNARKIVATEIRQYSNDGWTEAFNQGLVLATQSDYPGVPVQRYLPGASNSMRGALIAALAANPSAERFVFPAGLYPWIGGGLSPAHGLRPNVTFEFHNTILEWPADVGNGAMLQWTISTEPMERVRLIRPHFRSLNPAAVVYCVYAFNTTDVFIDAPTIEGPPGISTFGSKLTMLLSTSHDVEIRSPKIIRGQIGVAGLGQNMRNVLISNAQAVDCTDFAISAVSSDGCTINGFKLRGLQIDGIFGSGGVFVGGDGAELLDELTDIDIDGVDVYNAWTGAFANQPNAIHLNAAALTEHVRINGIQARDQGPGAASGQYGIRLIAPVGSSARGVSVTDCKIGQLGSANGVHGLISEWAADDLHIAGIDCFGNRGIFVADYRQLRMHDCDVRSATDDACTLRAATRNSHGRVHHNRFHSQQIFKVGFRVTDAGFNTELDLDHNDLLADLGNGASFVGSGTLTARLDDNNLPNDADAAFKAGIASFHNDRGLAP